MMRKALLTAALVMAPLIAQADVRLTQLIDLLNLDAYVEIIRDEGLADFPQLAEGFIGGPADTVLIDQIVRIYDAERLRETVRLGMERSLTPEDIEAALLYVGSETGQRVATLELAARRAMSDPAVEEAAKDAWLRAPEEKPWLVARIGEVIAASDLVERNVAGALNSNLMFMQGMADGGGTDTPQDDMLSDVWSQEQAIRTDTEAWLGAYLLLAYQPLSQEDLETYIGFWATQPGKALNAAMFEAFNEMFDGISYATARVLALRMMSQEL